MLKAIKSASVMLFFACFAVFALVFYGSASVPDVYYVTSGETVDTGNKLFTCEADFDSAKAVTSSTDRSYSAQIKLFKAIPVKNSTVNFVQRSYVTLSGEAFGLRIFTDGVMITGVGTVAGSTVSAPAKKAGIRQGDILQKINGVCVSSNADIIKLVEESGGKEMELLIKRNGKQKKLNVVPVKQAADGKYRIGIWVRDSSAGVGTLTFVDNDSGTFAGLGHAICDVDTGLVVPLRIGDILYASIRGCVKGTSGTPGELCGVFSSDTIGQLYMNCSKGVYGFMNVKDRNAQKIPVAFRSEVKTGKAQIVSTIDNGEPQYFDVEITKILKSNDEEKNMVIKVTDTDLLKKTGGIVQGMSGSPIIQNGMLVGAVTHVFVNDPQQGYAIFAETMVKTASQLEKAAA